MPDPYLRMVLRKLHELLAEELPPPHEHVYGFVKGRGIRANAANHLDKEAVLRVDLSEFFESISGAQVAERLREADFDHEACDAIVSLSTLDGHLAVGFNTSPVLSNAVFRRTDEDLVALAAREHLTFSRYVDDLTFSGSVPRDFASRVEETVSNHGWRLNHAKTRYQRRGGAQYVTGLTVNDRVMPRVPRSVKKALRWKLHYIERFGYDAYMSTFGGENSGDHPRRLLGWARHVASIEPHLGREMLARMDAAISGDYYASSDAYWEDWLNAL